MTGSQSRQEFCVRWNSHLGSIGAAFPQLLAGQRFVDVTLACEGHQVHCHRLVLAACSSYFENILAENPCKHPVIILPSEIKLWEIQALVDFMYKGEVNVTQAGLPQLLRCAEQLRIRGLYGSDAALNLNQLKAMTNKAAVAAATAAAAAAAASTAAGSTTNDSIETDDTGTNSTTATSATVPSGVQPAQHPQGAAGEQDLMHVKRDMTPIQQANGTTNEFRTNSQQQQLQQQQQQQQLQKQQNQKQHKKQQQQQQQQQMLKLHQQQMFQQAQHQLQLQQQPHTHPQHAHPQHAHLQQIEFKQEMPTNTTASNAPTEDESADDSTSNAYDDRYEHDIKPLVSGSGGTGGNMQLLDSTIEEDHNYVAHDEDSFGGAGDNEHETTTSSSLLQSSIDSAGSMKRVRRSEASLAQAAKCVSKGQTFQTVSNLFNIPVSTIRFYMARKGILPKRKRGRGAANSSQAATGLVVSQALAQMCGGGIGLGVGVGGTSGVGYKLNEQSAAHMI